MDPIEPKLAELLADMVAGGDATQGAHAHNYLFEERVTEERQRAYEAALELPSVGPEAWRDRHRSYLAQKVFVLRGTVPETFLPANSDALCGGLDTAQWVVRVERLDRVLAGLEIDLALVNEQLAALQGGRAEDEKQDARAFLEELCLHWNEAIRTEDRPAFAAFFDDVEPEIEATDWMHRLRNRLGLSHLNPAISGGQVPIALLRYRVEDVLSAAGADARHVFAVPTVLDGELNAHFFPAPRGCEYGRTLDLDPDPDCERLVAEILHRRIDYTPDHLFKVGWVTTPIPPHAEGPALARLRNGHLFCLKYESGRENFGAKLPEATDG